MAIKEARTAMGGTLANLGQRTGLSRPYLNNIERGRLPLPVETVLKIANAFSDVDSAAWLWLLLADVWGQPVADVMHRYAAAPAAEPGR